MHTENRSKTIGIFSKANGKRSIATDREKNKKARKNPGYT